MSSVSQAEVQQFDAIAQLALNPPPQGSSAELAQQHASATATIKAFQSSPDAWKKALVLLQASASTFTPFVCLQVCHAAHARRFHRTRTLSRRCLAWSAQTIEGFANSQAYRSAPAATRAPLGRQFLDTMVSILASVGHNTARRAAVRSILRKAAAVLALLLRLNFLDAWRSGVQDCIAAVRSPDVCDFVITALQNLSEDLVVRSTGAEKAHSDAVKDALRDDAGGLPAMAQFCLSALTTYASEAPYTAHNVLRLLAELVDWADITLVVNASLLPHLQSLLTVSTAELRQAAVGVYAAAVNKGKPHAAHVEVINSLGVIGALSSLALGDAADPDEADFNQEVAALITSIGKELLRAGDSPSVLSTPALAAVTAEQLSALLALALRIFSQPLYGYGTAYALMPLWDAVMAFWRASAGGAGVPKKHGSSDGTGSCAGQPAGVALGSVLEQALLQLVQRCRYPDGFEPLDDSLEEEGEALISLRHVARGLLVEVTKVSPKITLTLLLKVAGASPPPPGSPDTESPSAGNAGVLTQLSALAPGERELILWLAWLWGEGAMGAGQGVQRTEPLPWLLTCLFHGALGGLADVPSQLAFLDFAVRYYWVLCSPQRSGTLLPAVLGVALGEGGVASPSQAVRRRGAFVAGRLTKLVAKEGGQAVLAPHVQALVRTALPHTKFTYAPPGTGGKAVGGITTGTSLEPADQGHLFELIGHILAQQWMPAEQAAADAVAVISPLLADANRGSVLAQQAMASVQGAAAHAAAGAVPSDEEADGGTGVGLWLGHSLACIGHVLKGFDSPVPALNSTLDATLTLAWQVPTLLPTHVALRAKAIFLTRRMIPLLGDALLQVLPRGLGVFLDTNRGAALVDVLGLVKRCLDAYRERFVPLLAQVFPGLVQRVWLAVTPAVDAARAHNQLQAAKAAGSAAASERVVRSEAAQEGSRLFSSYLGLLGRMAALRFGADAMWGAVQGAQPSAPATLKEILDGTTSVALSTFSDPKAASAAVHLYADLVCAWLPQHALAASRETAKDATPKKKPLLLADDSSDAGSDHPGSSAGSAAPLSPDHMSVFISVLRDVWVPLSLRVFLRTELPLTDSGMAGLAVDVAAFHMKCADHLGLSNTDPSAGAAGVSFCQLLAGTTLPGLGVPSGLASEYAQHLHAATVSKETAPHRALGDVLLRLAGALRGQ